MDDRQEPRLTDTASSDFWQDIVHTLPDGYQIISPDGRILYANASIARRYQRLPDQLRGQALVNIWPGAEQTAIPHALSACSNNGQPQRLLARLTFPDGSKGLFQLIFSRVADGVCILSVAIDEQRHDSDTIQHKCNLFEAVVEQVPYTLTVLDKDGNILFANHRTAQNLCNGQPQDIIGKNIGDFTPPGNTRELLRKYRDVITTQTPLTEDVEVLLHDKVHWFFNRLFPLLYGADKIPAVLSTSLDITELKRIEQETGQRCAMLARTERIAKIGSWEWEIATDQVSWSEELFHIFQRDPARGAPSYAEHAQMYIPEDMQRLRQAVSRCVADGTPYEIELQAIRADGAIRHCLAHGEAVTSAQGQIHHLVGSLQDITERKLAEKQLLESEQRWKNILVKTPQIGVSLDPNGRIVFVNAYFLQLTGWNEEEVLGKDWFDLFIPDDEREEIRSLFRTVMEERVTGDYSTNENQILTKKGELREVAWSNVLTKALDGTILDVTCLGVDLTDRKRAEEAIHASERYLRRIVETAADGFLVIDRNGLVTESSTAYCAMSGYTPDELRGMRVDQIEATENASEAAAHIKHIIATGSDLFETHHRRKDGSLYPVEVSVTWSEENNGRFISFCRDISARKEAEEATLARERYLSTILETAADGFFVLDTQGRFLEANSAYCAMVGYTRDELLGLTINAIDPNETPVDTAARVEQIISKGALHFDVHHRRKDGTLIPLDVSTTFLDKNDGQFVTFCRDLSERKRAEEERKHLQTQLLQAQKMESVGRLAGGVAHDFNNMLSVIIGHTELAIGRLPATDPLCTDLREILSAARRSADITRQLLAFARKQIIMPKVLDLNQTVEEMLKMLRRLIGEDIDLTWLPSHGAMLVKIDPSQLDQILANLCVNARDAIAGTGKLTIETAIKNIDAAYCTVHPDFMPGTFVQLSVSDNGCGMDKQTLDKLFEPFFTTKDVGKGTGLGLATVYGIVKQNQGFINVYSEPSQGTTFRIYLPAHTSPTPSATTEPTESAPLPRGNETILLVEDEPMILKMTTLMLQQLGYRILGANTPDQAINLAREHTGEIDLLITDVIMPGMHGRDLANRLLTLTPALSCLFMSGYTDNVIAEHGVLDEGVHFIQKPFIMKEMAIKVRQILDQK